jgi:tryptophan synthase
MDAIKQTFAKCKEQKRAALVAYITAGYPTVEEAVDILLGLENGGAGNNSQIRMTRTIVANSSD